MKYFTASCDSEDTNKKFAESLDLDYPILSDPKRKAYKAMGIAGRNTIYVGKDGKIAFIDKKVNARKDAETVVKKLTELKVPEKKAVEEGKKRDDAK